MYGLPEDINLGFFSGKILHQACFGCNDLILNFDDAVRVTVISSIGYPDSSGNIRQNVDFREVASAVLTLLGRKVLSAEGNEVGTLTLKFEGGGMLMIYDDSEHYESYVIKNGGQLIVV